MSEAAARVLDASDPANSAWVSANAGSGKTYVLTNRVIRLLLDGAVPSRLLCLTYTRAAAAEMRQRVFDVLGSWAVSTDDAIRADIAQREGAVPDDDRLNRARRLFATALETPGGLKIQTIHAFCERLVARFPIEADAPVPFRVATETETRALKAEARAAALERIGAEGADSLMSELAPYVNQEGFAALFEGRAAVLIAKYGKGDPWAAAGLERFSRASDIAASAGYDDPGRNAFFRRAAKVLSGGGQHDNTVAAAFLRGLAADDPQARFEAISGGFFTTTGTLRAKIGLKALRQADPGLFAALDEEAARAAELRRACAAAESAWMAHAVARLGEAIAGLYREAKRARGVLDFDDLITAADHLLRDSDAAAWALYKLDGGLDHILIDEAQDTSPAQWRVVTRLADEFFAGKGVSAEYTNRPRTLFAVGDEKQSIFSFQGAVVAAFEETRLLFEKRAKGAKANFLTARLSESRRSVPPVLALADAVFAHDPALMEAVSAAGWTPHVAHRTASQGAVEIWPLAEADEVEDEDDWTKPVDAPPAADPVTKLAGILAAGIAGWIGRESVEGKDGTRPMQAGDVLILVRTRGRMQKAIIRCLKKEGVPVAGADRLDLLQHIAVKDLVAYGRAALLPQDDLNLAALLRSPFFDLSEDELFRLAYDRKPRSLWQRLNEAAADGATILKDPARAAAIQSTLRAAMDRMGRDTPFDFYARLLAEGGRAAMLRRLGDEAEDVIDEFLAVAASYEEEHAPSLEGFLHAIESEGGEVKRDPDAAGGAVRVLTAHGAKGLEAPVVILPDTMSLPSPKHTPDLLVHDGALVWRPAGSAEAQAATEAYRKAEHDEHKRLLYVALTRPRDRLVVCGVKPGRNMAKAATTWYDAVRAGFERLDCVAIETPLGPGLRHGQPGPPATTPPTAPAHTGLPAWARAKAAREETVALVRPSRLAPELVFDDAAAAHGLARGRLIHRLLQGLPDVAAAERPAAALRFLKARAPDWTDVQRHDVASQLVALLAQPQFAAAFAPGSRAEAPIAGRVAALGNTGFISGQIDRLAVTADDVLVVDYKTDRRVPADAKDVPVGYLGQMALYREAMRAAFPGRTVRCALLWTEGPALMELPDSVLDITLRRLAALNRGESPTDSGSS